MKNAKLLLLFFLTTALVQIGMPLAAAQDSQMNFDFDDYQRNHYTNENWAEHPVVLFLSSREGPTFNAGYSWTAPITGFVHKSEGINKTVIAAIFDRVATL